MVEMTYQDYAELFSILLTVPTIALAIYVLYLWGPSAIELIKGKDKNWKAPDWFIMGVTLGFLGGALDNLYWQIAWFSSFAELEQASFFFYAGCFFNIIFRQGLGISAAYCHIKSHGLHTNKDSLSWLNAIALVSVFLGCANALLAYILRIN